MIFFIFVGIIMICKPPFIFGWTDLYTTDPQAKWAVLALILSSIFIQSNIFVIMRRLKGKNFVLVHNSLGVFKCPKVQMRLMSLINGCQGCLSFFIKHNKVEYLF